MSGQQDGLIRAMGFPRRYVQGPGAVTEVASLLQELGIANAGLLVDAVVADQVRTTLAPELQRAGIQAQWRSAPGECSRDAIADISAEMRSRDTQAVVAFGGGKTIDIGKGVASALGARVLICPTVASSDAPTSRLIVLYNQDHSVAGVDFLRFNPDAVIVDTQIIVQAPPHLFSAGIGDAVSKRFEAAQCLAADGRNSFGTRPLGTALLLAEAAYAVLRDHGAEAYRDVCDRRLTVAVERTVEATVLLSGLGFESGGLSVAHALIRGLTTIPELAARLHGELVAYGTLVQLCFENRPPHEIDELTNLLDSVALPRTLAALGCARPLSAAETERVAAATLANSYAANTSPRLTAGAILDAIGKAERLGSATLAMAVA